MVRRFLYLNGIAIICVILFHAGGMGFVAMFNWIDRYNPGLPPTEQIGSLPYYVLRFIEQIVIFAIPAFLIVSGYFISFATGKNQETIKWRIIFSRIGYLIVPYLIWSAVALGFLFIRGMSFTPVRTLEMLLVGKTNEIYYYVPLLIQLYLISPFLVRWAKRNWKSLLAVTGIIQIIAISTAYPMYLGKESTLTSTIAIFFPKWFFVTRIFWFSLGIVLGERLAEFKKTFYPLRWILLGGALLLIPVGMIEWETYFKLSGLPWLSTLDTLLDIPYELAIIFGILAFDKAKFPFFDRLSWLGTKSYGIYLIHGLVIEYVAKMIYRFLPRLLAYQVILQPVLILLGLGIPLLLMMAFDKSPLRRFYTYIFG